MFDGVHFNARGNGLIFDWLSSAIAENFPSLRFVGALAQTSFEVWHTCEADCVLIVIILHW